MSKSGPGFPYRLVALGGTFDGVHKGHIAFLQTALSVGARAIIGLTSDELVKKLRKKHHVRNYEFRRMRLAKQLARMGARNRARIVRLYEEYGPALTSGKVEALVVSEDTLSSGIKLNRLRSARKLPRLHLIVVPLVRAEDERAISTTRVKRGEIDTLGRVLLAQSKKLDG